MRVGLGYDSHRFDDSRSLVLGGVPIPDSPGLAGFSDGDAVAHAVIDAVLGAAAAGDIGTHFPSGDERWRNADSLALLVQATRIVQDRDYRVSNVDVTVVCEAPRIGPHAAAMSERLAQAMDLTAAQVSVKGKSNDGMGWTGSREGLAVYAVALLERA